MGPRIGRWPPRPENVLYNDTYQLAGPESTDLVPSDPASGGGLQSAHSGGMGGGGGAAPAPRGPREWLLLVLWRQKWVVMVVLALSLVAGWGYMQVTTPMYASTAKISVQQATPLLGQSLTVQEGDSTFRHTQKDLLTSEPVLLIASAKVGKLRTFNGAPVPVSILKNYVGTDLDRNSSILTVTGYSPFADDAEVIANGVVDAFMTYQSKPKVSTAHETLRLLDTRRKETEAKLKAAIDGLGALEAAHGPLAQRDEHTNIVLQQLKGLSEALLKAQTETIEAKSAFEDTARALGIAPGQLEQANPAETDPDFLVASTPQAQMELQREMLQSQTILQELQQRYLPNHPAIVGMKRRLEQLNLKYVASIRRRYVASQHKEREFQKSYDDAQQRAINVTAHAKDYARLQDEVERLKKERDNYSDRIRSAELEIQGGNIVIDVHEPAHAQVKPSIPNPKRVLPIALAAGLVAGLMLACLREWVDDRFRSAGEIKNSLGMPILAVIPQSTTKRSPSVSGQRILLDPASDAAEAYRSLRTAVQFAAPEGQMKTLLVTSPASGDGKTTLASNLAIAMAQAGKKVCLVDADLRKPAQHEIFGVKNNTGLSMLLAGRCTLDTATQRANVTGLEILPCGPVPSNPTEILNSREFGETMELLAEKYDVVVIDSPPAEAVNDTRIIAAQCDATLIVLKAQTAHRRSAERTRDSLLGVGAKIIGLVVNDLPRRTHTAYGQMAGNRRYVPGLTSQEYDLLQARAK